VHPVDYLVAPRVLAMMLSMPLLVGECCAFGIVACYLVAVPILGISEPSYMRNLLHWTVGSDIIISLVKGYFFGIVIVLIGCHEGLKAENGAAGVGRAPTEAVVNACLFILILNFVLTFALNIFLGKGT
jgi:phospholipid/cholesterol/gamma-HCH transport system permease protein